MKNQPAGPEQPKIVPELEPAESFTVEFLNSRGIEVRNAITSISDFSFKRSGSEDENSVFFEGERKDGTIIKIVIEKGQNYKSPAKIEKEIAAEKNEN